MAGASPPAADTLTDGNRFPSEPDPTNSYPLYLIGKITEDEGLPATGPEYSEYQHDEILKVLESYGFEVTGKQWPRNADGWEYARRTARQAAEIITAGVPLARSASSRPRMRPPLQWVLPFHGPVLM